MRIPNTDRLQYYDPRLVHFVPAAKRDLVRRSSWSPGYYSQHLPLLTPTLEPERDPREEGGKTNDAEQPPVAERKEHAGRPDK